MKTLLGLLLISLVSVVSMAQDTTRHDPLLSPLGGYPVLANSVEIVSITDSVTGTPGRVRFPGILDLAPGSLIKEGTLFNVDVGGMFDMGTNMWVDCIADDFDGDGQAEIVNAWITPYTPPAFGRMSLELSGATRFKPSYNWTWDPKVLYNDGNGWYNGPVRMVAAKLDSTPSRKIITCSTFNDAFWLVAWSWDGQSLSELGRTDWGTGSGNAWPDYDIAAGDFDGDGLDEIILVAHDVWGSSNHSLDVYTFKYNRATKEFVVQGRKGVSTTSGQWAYWKRLKATTGDFRNVGHDEAVVSLTWFNGTLGIPHFNYVNTTPDAGGFLSLYANPPGYNVGLEGNGSESNVVAADLNPSKNDGDELVEAGPGWVAILKFNASHLPYIVAGGNAKTPFLNPGAIETYERHRFLAVGDMDPDTSSARWVPEIIVAEHKQDTTSVFRVLVPIIDAADSITGLTQKSVFSAGRKSLKSEIAVGDFDGDAMQLGAPKLVTVQNFYQPIVMLNVPPTHFDTLGGQAYDICKVHGTSPSDFRVTYTETQSQTSHFESEMNHSWGASAEISGGFQAFGFKVNAYAKVAYDGGYYGARSADTMTTASQVTESYGDDWILATVSDLDFWEYPVHAMGTQVGSFLVQIPHFKGTQWFPSRNVIARDWMAEREVGNLFSYVPKDRISSWAGENLLTSFTGKYVSIASAGSWTLDLSTQTIDANRLTHSIGAEVGLSVKKWGVEAKVSGRYSKEQVKTHTSTATKDVLIEVKVSDTDKTFGDTDYLVTPYIYWGQNGALVVDYGVDPSSIGDPVLGTFWDQKYLSRSDPALILPWRLDSLKGIGGTENIRMYCRSLHVSPKAPSAGGTVHITANVHNYSLKSTTGPVTVRFYLGDPANGGIPIVGTGGLTDLSTTGPIPARDRATVEMDWIVPSGLDNTAKVYVAVDPDNVMDEIHEDNNVGFVPLRVGGAVGVEDEEPPPLPALCVLHQNYPNPFNPTTVIPFELPERSHVTLTVYDLLGRTVATLVNEVREVGRHHVVFNGKGLATGMYFCQLAAGPFVGARKMLVVR